METVFLIGAAQGVFLAAVLASRSGDVVPNRLLAGLLLVFSIDLAMGVYHASSFSTRYPGLVGLDLPIAFLYGPLLYLYARTLAEHKRRLTKSDAWHALPFVLLVLFLVPFYLQSGAEKLAVITNPGLSLQMRAFAVINPLKLIHGGIYLTLVVRLIRSRGAREKSGSSPSDLRWLRHLTAAFVGLFALTMLFFVLGGGDVVLGMDPDGLYDDFTLLVVTLFVYGVGYFKLRPPKSVGGEKPVPYARSGMDTGEAAQYRDRLVALMESDHLFRRADLTPQHLADSLSITPHNLAEVLTTQLGVRFSEFVNGYRIREVRERLVDPEFADWTVLAIGLEAGFGAKSSFNSAFKRHTGITPSAYRAGEAPTV